MTREPPLVMSRAELEAIGHYQTTQPTGLPIGRRWRRCFRRWSAALQRRVAWKWYVAEVVAHDGPMAVIRWRSVDVLDAHPVDVKDTAG